MRVLLLAGKGGAGTTTVAAATALTAARAGIKTLLLSTDRTSSLSDVLGVRPPSVGQAAPQGSLPVPFEVQAGLAVLQADPWLQATGPFADLQRSVGQVLDAVRAPGLDADDLLSLSGLDELSTVSSLVDQVADGPWDLVLVDVGGGDRALRLLSAPDDLVRALNRLTAPPRRLGLHTLGLDTVARTLSRLHAELAALRDVLHAPTSSVRLVMTPESVGLVQARRAFTSLAVQGFTVDGIIANQVLPAGGENGSWLSSRAAAQAGVLAEADEVFAPVAVQRLPYLPVDPVGPDALAQLGASLLRGQAASDRAAGPSDELERLLASPVTGAGPHVRRVDGGYELVIAAPFASARDVQLSRDGDELRLGVHGTWRVLALPSVLRRCVALGAQVGAGSLVVRFRPDPSLWPVRSAARSAAEGEK